MATRPLRKAVALPTVEAYSSPETAAERLRSLLEVFRLLIMLRKKAQEHHVDKQVYAAFLHTPLLRDPGKLDTLLDIDESQSLLPFVSSAILVFAVTVLDNLLKSLERFLRENGNKELVAKANAIVRDWSRDESGQGADRRLTGNPGKFRKRYVFVSLYLGLMEEQEARDALKQPTKKPILDKRFAVLELYRKRCVIAHDDPFADMGTNPVDDYVSAYSSVQRLAKKWNASFPPALNHESTTGTS
jgi:hypothetical protein